MSAAISTAQHAEMILFHHRVARDACAAAVQEAVAACARIAEDFSYAEHDPRAAGALVAGQIRDWGRRHGFGG